MTVWGVSTFNNELDVLEIRLETLDHLVDRWILTEQTVTQRGQAKPLYFEENKERYAKWLHKIDHVIVEDAPGGEGYDADWVRERNQRNQSARVLYEQLNPGDHVLLSDLDEIPYPEALEESFNLGIPTRFLMDMFVYRLNWRWLDRACHIGSTATVMTADYFASRANLHDIMFSQSPHFPNGPAGWHLAYQGDVDFLRLKMTSIADRFYEQLVPEEKKGDPDVFLTDAWIQESIDTGRDIYGRDYRPSEWVGIEEMPPCVQADPEKYAHMMVPKPDQPHANFIRCTCGAYYNDQKELCHFPKCELFVG